MTDKLKTIHGGGNKNEAKEALRELREALPEYIKSLTLIAQMTRAKYKALIAEGFTPEEALELSKTL